MRPVIAITVLFGLLAATGSPEGWLRQGNAAFERGDYRGALDSYAHAMNESRDPGQVAFDQASAHYQLGEFREAELCYRRSLEDAGGTRRVRALYGLANSLAQAGHARRGRAAVSLLKDAVEQYDACILTGEALTPADQAGVRDVLENARFNQELVKVLLEHKLADTSKDNPPANSDNADMPPNDDPNKGSFRDPTRQDGESPGNRQRGNRSATGTAGQVPPGSQPQSTNESQPGQGNLPVLSDDANAAPLTPEQALDYLQRNLDRIRRDRASRMTPPDANVKGLRDW